MHWNAFDTAPSFGELRSEAEHLGANRYALRVSELAVQAGFAKDVSHRTKSKGKVYSLAARLASAVAEPWFGVFDLGDGKYWYIAVRDGYSILPDGDVIGSSDDIDQVRDSHSGFNDWKIVKGDIQTLEELLGTIAEQETAGSIPKSKLVVVNYLGPSVQLPWRRIAIAITALGVAGGAIYWKNEQDEQKARFAAEQIRRSQALAQANQALAPLAAPLPNEFLKACQEILLPLPLSEYAWKLSQVGCSEKTAFSQWKLTLGATVKSRPTGVLNSDGSQIDQIIDLKIPSNDQSIILPGTLEENLLSLRYIAQRSGLDLQFSNQDEQAGSTLPGQSGPVVMLGDNQTAKVLRKQAFTLSSKVAPFAIDFSTVPGMRISRVSSILSDSDGWKLEGIVYGR